MPAEHGPQLATLYPDARLVVLEDCATLIGENQPERFAALLTDFVTSARSAERDATDDAAR